MTKHTAQLMAQLPHSIFGELKQAAAASTKTIIDLSLGSPDLPPDERVRQRLAELAAKPTSYGYTLKGTSRFNEAVAAYYATRYDVDVAAESEILQTMGSQEGLVHLPLAFCNQGDIVLTTNPGYVAYEAGIRVAGAIPYYMPLLKENDYLPDLQAIPEDVAKKAKLIILNLPGNPVPAMPSIPFFKEVIAFAKKHHIIVLHDAAYSEFYFEGDRPFSFLQIDGAKEVGLEINSLSKSFSLAGARIAYFLGNARLIETLAVLKSHLDYGIFEPIQEAAIVAFEHAEEITDNVRKTFKKRHTLLSNGLKELGWDVIPSAGGMFLYAKYPQQTMDDCTFVFQLIEETGIVLVPGSAFGSEGKQHVRIALVQEEHILQQALTRITSWQKQKVSH